MSLEQKKDALTLFSLVIIPAFLVIVFYQYSVSNDAIYLILGIATVILIIIVILVKFKDIVNYVKRFFERWK